MTAAIKAQLAAYAKIKPPAQRQPDGATDVPPAPLEGTSATPAAPTANVAPPAPAGYGTVAVEGFTGRRFICVAAPPELVQALAAVCQAHGARALSTTHFILESVPGSGPKVKVKSSE